MMGIFVQSFVPHSGKAKLALHDAKEVFDFGSYFRFVPVFGAVSVAESYVTTAFLVGEVFSQRSMISNYIALTRIGRITPDTAFITVKKISQNGRVMNISGRSHNRVNQLGFAVDSDMSLHAEVPLITFSRLMHIRIALLFLVLGRTRRIDDTGIDDGAPAYFQAIFLEVLINQIKQTVAQTMTLHQMTEFADRCLVGSGLFTQIDTDKLTHGTGIVQSLLRRRIRQVKPVLQEMNTQHSLNAYRTSSSPSRVGIERFDGFTELFPGNNGFHILKKLLFTRFLAVFLEAVCKRCLFHAVNNRDRSDVVLSLKSRINQSVPKNYDMTPTLSYWKSNT